MRELFYRATAVEGAPEKRALVYLPSGYTPEKKYPVLYLLHGIGGDETEWQNGGGIAVLDELFASGAARDTIVVMPNGRTCTDFRNRAGHILGGRIIMTDNVRGFYKFDKELRNDLIPAVEAAYPVIEDRTGRALAGLSMGGMQALNFGTKMTDLFAHIGAFSCGLTTGSAEDLLASIREGEGLETLYLACGDADEGCYPIYEGLVSGFEGVEPSLVTRFVSETLPGGKHDFAVWNHGLNAFLFLAFYAD